MTIRMDSSMDAPSGQLYKLVVHQDSDTMHHVRWEDPAGHKHDVHVAVLVDNNDGLISLPYSDNAKIADIMRKAQELVDEAETEAPGWPKAVELQEMLKEYRGGFHEHRMGLYEMLEEDGLAEWRWIGPEDRELFATKKLTGEK